MSWNLHMANEPIYQINTQRTQIHQNPKALKKQRITNSILTILKFRIKKPQQEQEQF